METGLKKNDSGCSLCALWSILILLGSLERLAMISFEPVGTSQSRPGIHRQGVVKW